MTRTSPATWAVEAGYWGLSRVSGYTAWKHFRRLQENQWLPREELEVTRWTKLRELLEHAEKEIPFYRRLWQEAGVQPGRFSRIDDIRELPVVTKADLIQAQAEDAFRLSERNDFAMTHTSGTTGPCMYLPFTKSDMQIKYAAYLREFYATDWRLGMRSAAMHYSGHPEFAGRYTGTSDRDNFVAIRKLAFRAAHRRIVLIPYHKPTSGDDSFAAEWYRKLRRHRPFLLESMDFNLITLCNHIQKQGLPPLSIPRTFVLATLAPGLRERLEETLGTETFDRYGPHEIEGVAYACHEHRGMHMAIDTVHTEFLDDADRPVEPGVSGHIVLTDLYSRVMPLIRYRIGDVGSAIDEPCSCGRSFPLMEEIGCRTRDRFELADGELVVPTRLVDVLQEHPGIDLFQLVQRADRHIEVRVVPKEAAWSEDEATRIRRELAALLPAGSADFTVLRVENVDLERNGKFCFAKRVD